MRWLSQNFKANEKKIKIVYPGVDKNKFYSINKSYSNEKNRRLKLELLFVGRLGVIKDFFMDGLQFGVQNQQMNSLLGKSKRTHIRQVSLGPMDH